MMGTWCRSRPLCEAKAATLTYTKDNPWTQLGCTPLAADLMDRQVCWLGVILRPGHERAQRRLHIAPTGLPALDERGMRKVKSFLNTGLAGWGAVGEMD